MSQDTGESTKKPRERLRLLKSEGEVIRQHMIRDCAAFLKTWYEAKAKEYVVKEAEKTKQLSKDRIKEMKEKVLRLGESAEEIVDKIFNDPSFTMPFEEGPSAKNQESSIRGEEFLRFALGKLGPILQDYGYLTDIDHWFRVDTVSGGIITRYPYIMDLPQNIVNLISEYNSLVTEARELSRQIMDLFSKDNSNKEAENLWDSL
jgi:uncharacterized protein YeeX (DUF496 family)